MITQHLQSNNAELKEATQTYHEVECRKKIFFFNICNQTKIEVVDPRNCSGLLLSRSLHDCRFYDNTMFGLISHFCSQVNLSTSENELAKNKTKVISTRVTERFAELLEQYCRQDAYINCADFIRDALREKLRNDAPDLFKHPFDGKKAAVDSDVQDVREESQAQKQFHSEGVDNHN